MVSESQRLSNTDAFNPIALPELRRDFSDVNVTCVGVCQLGKKWRGGEEEGGLAQEGGFH